MTLSRCSKLILHVAASGKILIGNTRELVSLEANSLALEKLKFEVNSVLAGFKEVPSGVEKVRIEELCHDSIDEPLGFDDVNCFCLCF